MSAESKESQPSIDDILSSIREIIADDSAEKSAPESAPARNPDTVKPRSRCRKPKRNMQTSRARMSWTCPKTSS